MRNVGIFNPVGPAKNRGKHPLFPAYLTFIFVSNLPLYPGQDIGSMSLPLPDYRTTQAVRLRDFTVLNSIS